MLISEVSKICNVTIDSVRYYQKKNLLMKPLVNRSNGYGIYSDEHIARINFIKKLQSFGFSLREIKAAIDLEEDNALTNEKRLDTLNQKLDEVNEKISLLTDYRNSLKTAISYLSNEN